MRSSGPWPETEINTASGDEASTKEKSAKGDISLGRASARWETLSPLIGRQDLSLCPL